MQTKKKGPAKAGLFLCYLRLRPRSWGRGSGGLISFNTSRRRS